ncbi:NAD-dependent epimerase/dehydratase family protein [Paracnuella aquatica]|uniref:NAD-dependent epimerase/dehydratase family protein n=1 Tax=Paracnuella aquatica TaxID=2268757 RepID=UPI001F4DD33C|nr:NAD-dependent epimerase/dehydratase family protein [Paracnuella aquatica]
MYPAPHINLPRKVFLTGGTGFLGAYILQNLVQKGIAVRALRRSGKLPFFIPQHIAEAVEWVPGDVLDVVALADAMEGVDAIIHSAAVVSFDKTDRQLMMAVNEEGTANVVNTALEAGVQRMVHVSSVAALGRTTKAEKVSEAKKWSEGDNNTDYAKSKHKAEMHVWRGMAEGLEAVIINPSTILGYGDWHQSSCAIFKSVYNEFPWYSTGVNGFVGVEDVAEAAVQLLLSGISEQRFIVSAENISFEQLFQTIAAGFGKKPPHREATPALAGLAWRMEAIKALFTGKKPLLTADTARVARSRTEFDSGALLQALPQFRYTPLPQVITAATARYLQALKEGTITL